MFAKILWGVMEKPEGFGAKANRERFLEQATSSLTEDRPVLLSLNNPLPMLGQYPTALLLAQQVTNEGMAPFIEPDTNNTMVDDLITKVIEALTKGIDPTLFLGIVNNIDLDEVLLSGGGHFYIHDPYYGEGMVEAGYDTRGVYQSYLSEIRELGIPFRERITLLENSLLPGEVAPSKSPVYQVMGTKLIQVQEDALPDGNSEGSGQVSLQTVTLHDLFTASATVSFSFSLEQLVVLPALESKGFPLQYGVRGEVLLGYIEHDGQQIPIFRAILHPDGTLSYEQLAVITHAGTNDDLQFQEFDLSPFIKAHFSDAAPQNLPLGTVIVQVENDVPSAESNLFIQMNDDLLANGNPGGVGDDAVTDNIQGILNHSFGADGAGNLSFLTSGAPAGFEYELSGNDLLIKQGTKIVLTLSLDPLTGAYTLTQNAAILHSPGDNENNICESKVEKEVAPAQIK